MQHIWKIVLIGSIILNIVAIWGFFHYIRYGGSPLGELKRKLTGNTRQVSPKIPYADENEQIKKMIASGQKDSTSVVFFGASITRRWDLKSAFPDVNMINRGVGGQLVPQMLTRFYRDVIELQPKAVVIKFCSINIRPRMPLKALEDGMTMMTELAQAHDIQPIVATIIPAGKPEAHIGDFSVIDTLKKFNEWVREFAKERNLPLIDFAKAIGDEEGFLPRSCSVDPVHVNDKGYEILAKAARPVIYQVVGVKK